METRRNPLPRHTGEARILNPEMTIWNVRKTITSRRVVNLPMDAVNDGTGVDEALPERPRPLALMHPMAATTAPNPRPNSLGQHCT